MTQEILYLIDYADECLPCSATREGWAEWLSRPDEEWRRPEAAKDGERFGADLASVTYHRASAGDEGETSFSPDLPSRYDVVAITFGEGMGWSAEDIETSATDLEIDDGDWVAAVQYGDRVVAIYRSDPPRLEIEGAPDGSRASEPPSA